MADEPCPQCGGDCAPECGMHPMGCTFGGFSCGYWLAAVGCDRKHDMEHVHGPEVRCPSMDDEEWEDFQRRYKAGEIEVRAL